MSKVVAIALLLAAVAAMSAYAGPGASRIVDRTLLCSTRQSGGIYEVEARSYSGTRESRTRWARLPFAVASTGETAAANTALQNSLAWISAGRPHEETLLGEYFFAVHATLHGTFAVNRRICRTVSTRIPLTSAGLTGGQAGQLGEIFDCGVPRRVLVRVRAVFESPTTLKGHDIFLLTTTPVQEARLAVRTQSGKPLVYATVAASGRSTLFTGKGCFAS